MDSISVPHGVGRDGGQFALILRSPPHSWKGRYSRCLWVSTSRECVQRTPLNTACRKPCSVRIGIFRIRASPGIIGRIWEEKGCYSAIPCSVCNLQEKKETQKSEKCDRTKTHEEDQTGHGSGFIWFMTAFVLKRIQANGLRGPEPLKYVRLSQVFALQMKQLQPPGRTQLPLDWFSNKMGTSVDNDARKSSKWLDQW